MRMRPGKDVRDQTSLARMVNENRLEEARVKAKQILDRQAVVDAARAREKELQRRG